MRCTLVWGFWFCGFAGIGAAGAEPLSCGGDALGAPCLTGLAGHCAYGRVICRADGAPICAPRGTPEQCNGIDDDCNGLVDDDCARSEVKPRRTRRRPQRPARAGVPG